MKTTIDNFLQNVLGIFCQMAILYYYCTASLMLRQNQIVLSSKFETLTEHCTLSDVPILPIATNYTQWKLLSVLFRNTGATAGGPHACDVLQATLEDHGFFLSMWGQPRVGLLLGNKWKHQQKKPLFAWGDDIYIMLTHFHIISPHCRKFLVFTQVMWCVCTSSL